MSKEQPAKADLSDEIHHRLSKKEMAEIQAFREKLAYKSLEQTHKLYYEWTVTRKITARQHTLLGIYLFS